MSESVSTVRRMALGALVAVAGVAGLTASLVTVRGHLVTATPALALVIPVIAGAVIGGLWSGVVAVTAGFLAYDFYFIPPYGTFAVGGAQNWTALIVYGVVMLVVTQMVSILRTARAEARSRELDTRRLYLVSDVLIGDKSLHDLLTLIVDTIHEAFRPRWVAALLPEGDTLEVVATSGEPMTDDERARLAPRPGTVQSLRTTGGDERMIQLALTARTTPIGLLAMSGPPIAPHEWELLRTFANQAALALERSQLRAQVVHAEFLEEVDRWRDALMGAVSHDLRTPLATVKTAVSTLRRRDIPLDEADQAELLELIETQSDNLARLVTNLLDMTRIRAGSLELRREVAAVADLVAEAIQVLSATKPSADFEVRIGEDIPLVDIDPTLIVQVLTNLIENAERYSPAGRPIEISAAQNDGSVEISVRDYGPGVELAEREGIFKMFNPGREQGRAGLGLTIAQSFVEAHGQHISVEDAPGGGARFVFSVPAATQPDAA